MYTHVGLARGRLAASDLANALYEYNSKRKQKSLLEEAALARLLIGYREVTMEDLVSTRGEEGLDADHLC